MKHVIAIFLLFSFTRFYAQDFSLAGVEYFSYPDASLKDAVSNQKLSTQEFGAFINIPVRLKNRKTILLSGLRYGLLETRVQNIALFDKEDKKQFSTASFTFTLVHQWNDKWTLLANLTPTLASDFEEDLSKDDLITQVFLLASKKISSSFTLGGGVIYTTQTGEPKLLPAIQVKFEKDRHSLTGFLPAKINYSFKVDKKRRLGIGIRVAMNGANINISSQDFSNIITNPINKVIYSRANAGPVLNYFITNNLQLEFFGGLSTARKFQLIDFDEMDYKFDAENGVFFNVGLKFIPSKKNNSAD